MISKDCTITIDKGNASVDEDVYLYKNDMNIQILFTIVNNKYRYTKNTADNIIENNKASYAQVKFKKGDIEIDFEEQETKEGAVVLLIKKELIDEDTELGDYSIQIRLFDENKTSVITLPPVENCIHIQRPLFEKAGEDTNIVDQALTDMAVVTYAEPISATNSDGTYNKKTWVAKEKITTAELNRMEDGIAYNNTQFKDMENISINDINTPGIRIVTISDIHMYEGEGQGGLSSEQRMNLLKEKLLEENDRKKINCMFIVGDLSMNDTQLKLGKDGLKWVKENLMNKLPFPVYALNGNHDNGTDEQWVNIFGYKKNFTVTFNDIGFICADTFNTPNTAENQPYTYSAINYQWLKEQFDKFKNKKIYLLCHFMDLTKEDAQTVSLLKSSENLQGIIIGHTHEYEHYTKENIKIAPCGHFSYPPSYDWTVKKTWGWRELNVLENGDIQNKYVKIENIYPDYAMPYTETNRIIMGNRNKSILSDFNTTFDMFSKRDEYNSMIDNYKYTKITTFLNNLSANFPITFGVASPTKQTQLSNTYLRVINKPFNRDMKLTKFNINSYIDGTVKICIFKNYNETNTKKTMILSYVSDNIELTTGANSIDIDFAIKKGERIGLLATTSLLSGSNGGTNEELIVSATNISATDIGKIFEFGYGTKIIQCNYIGYEIIT